MNSSEKLNSENSTINIRVAEINKKDWEREAEARNLSLSEFIRQAVNKEVYNR